MNKQNLMTITFVITGLSMTPVMAERVEQTRISQNLTIQQSIASSVSSLLYKRGLEKDAADEIVSNFISEEDEVFLATIIHHLESKNIVTKEEVLKYLSNAALRKEKLDVNRYDHLVGMVSKIKNKPLDEEMRKTLSKIAKVNKQLFV